MRNRRFRRGLFVACISLTRRPGACGLRGDRNFGQNYFDDVTSASFRKPINIITPPRTGQFGFRFRF